MMDLHTELTELRKAILEMGAAVEQRMFQVCDSLTAGDLDAARTVRHGDNEIDEMELAIEEGSTMVRVGTDLLGPRPV